MWELTKRISLRTLSVLSKVEPEPDLSTGSDQKVPAPVLQLKFKYLSENLTKIENILTCWSVAQVNSNKKKTGGKIPRWTVPS